jgi:hypothetical protein
MHSIFHQTRNLKRKCDLCVTSQISSQNQFHEKSDECHLHATLASTPRIFYPAKNFTMSILYKEETPSSNGVV